MSRATKAAAALRQQECLKLAAEGLTFQQIADRVGYAHRGNACRVINRALQEVVPEAVAELRRIEDDRLDALLRALWGKAMAGDATAVNAVLRIVEARIRLHGLAGANDDHRGPNDASVVLTFEEMAAMASSEGFDRSI